MHLLQTTICSLSVSMLCSHASIQPIFSLCGNQDRLASLHHDQSPVKLQKQRKETLNMQHNNYDNLCVFV